jgi:hypothetical protein
LTKRGSGVAVQLLDRCSIVLEDAGGRGPVLQKQFVPDSHIQGFAQMFGYYYCTLFAPWQKQRRYSSGGTGAAGPHMSRLYLSAAAAAAAAAAADGAYLEGFREYLSVAAASGERSKPNPGAGAEASGQAHLWRDFGGMKTKQRIALVQEMQKVRVCLVWLWGGAAVDKHKNCSLKPFTALSCRRCRRCVCV